MKREYQVPKSTTTEVDAQTMYLDNISFTVVTAKPPTQTPQMHGRRDCGRALIVGAICSHSSLFILHSSFSILHSSFFILHSSFFTLHSSFFT